MHITLVAGAGPNFIKLAPLVWAAEKAKADEVEIAVQVCGKVRAKAVIAADAAEDEVKEKALAAVEEYTAGKNIVKVIVVKGRLVNVVAK